MPNENDRLSIEQQRSKFAFDIAKNKDKEFGSIAKKVPAYIQTNGFVYTMAFLNDKKKIDKEGKKNNHYLLLEGIFKWHCEPSEEIPKMGVLTQINDLDTFLTALFTLKISENHNLTDDDIRIITIETLALFTWLRRFVKDDE